ncbi:MAG: hypothetical protein AB1489_16210 [Acidobacteriota bacterium]
MVRGYKEIRYGIAIGISMWTLDVMMHTSTHGPLSLSAFIEELLANDSTQLFFRNLFVIVSVSFGLALWQSNRHKNQVKDLQVAMDSFQREIVNPLLLITGYSQLLSLKEGWPVNREEIEMVREIQLNRM